MLYTETPDDVLEKYTEERCKEVKDRYDDLKRSIMQLASVKDELEKFELMERIAYMIRKMSDEHLDTLDRYLYAYESTKRLSNVISILKKEEE